MSSWFICFWPAERNRSQSAPSWIWVFSVPEESKLKRKVTPGFWAEYVSAMAFRVSVREAAAKTISSTDSPEASEDAASEKAAAEEAVLEAAPPQAVRAAAPTAPTTDRKLRREMRSVFMNFLLL